MKLTNKELEVMAVLWHSKVPMTTTEIINASNNQTWKRDSIFIMMNTLLRKEAVIVKYRKATASNTARAYEPLITSEKYVAQFIGSVQESGIDIDIDTLIQYLKTPKE